MGIKKTFAHIIHFPSLSPNHNKKAGHQEHRHKRMMHPNFTISVCINPFLHYLPLEFVALVTIKVQEFKLA